MTVEQAGRRVRAGGGRGARADETRELIMATAERLFAEHGLVAVSSRQISEAAGQGNNTAVGYHFGTKAELVRAIIHKHGEPVEALRRRMVERIADSRQARDWVGALVRPLTDHLADLGVPSWHARFTAQVVTDPVLRVLLTDHALASPSLQRLLAGLRPCLPALPAPVRAERWDMARNLLLHTCAERELALAGLADPPKSAWARTADSLTDAMTGLLLAPASPRLSRVGRTRAAASAEREGNL